MLYPKRSQVADEHAKDYCERQPFAAGTKEQGYQDGTYDSERHLPESRVPKSARFELWSGDRSKEAAGASEQAHAPQCVAKGETAERYEGRREGD